MTRVRKEEKERKNSVSLSGLANEFCESPTLPKPHQQTDPNWAVLEKAERECGKPLEMSDFSILRKLGTGSSATVFLVKLRHDVASEARFALKVFHKNDFSKKNKIRRIRTEYNILCTTDHPFVVTMYRTFADKTSIGFLMEYCERGDMYQLLQRQPSGKFHEYRVRVYVAQVVIALQYMHLQGYVYRDLKPENILLCADGHVKLTDFDLSRQVEPPSTTVHHPKDTSSGDKGDKQDKADRRGARGSSKKMRLSCVPKMRSTSFVGTDEYIAPEVITCRGYSSSVDWWGLGIFLYEMIYGCTPFVSKNRHTCFKKILEEELQFPALPHVSSGCKDLIRRLLVKDPAERLGSTHGASEIKAHPFFETTRWALLRYKR